MQYTDAYGVMHGYWTATPAKGQPSFALGYGTSKDGLHWELHPPAAVVLPKGMPDSPTIEVGGVAMMPNGKWYVQACAIQWGHIDHLGGCFSAVAEQPAGPFVLQEKNFALLGYKATDGIPAYFSRFYLGENGDRLANYQQAGHASTYLAPLKKAVVDAADNTTLRWTWFDANDALKGVPVVNLSVGKDGTVTPPLNVLQGTLLEGTLKWPASTAGGVGDSGGAGAGGITAGGVKGASIEFYGGSGGGGGATGSAPVLYGKLALVNGVLQLYMTAKNTLGSIQGITADAPQPSRSLSIKPGDTVRWRMLWRRSMYEIYFATEAEPSTFYFGASYRAATGDTTPSTLKLVGAFANANNQTTLSAWTMTLP
eukprot:gene17774-12084_t